MLEPLSPDLITRVHTVGVDRDMCITAASCLAYNIYELDDEAKAVLLTKNGSNSDEPTNLQRTEDGYVTVDDLLNTENESFEEMQKRVLESAQSCPFNAIIVKDAEGTIIWPLQ
jgi:ferredoxin